MSWWQDLVDKVKDAINPPAPAADPSDQHGAPTRPDASDDHVIGPPPPPPVDPYRTPADRQPQDPEPRSPGDTSLPGGAEGSERSSGSGMTDEVIPAAKVLGAGVIAGAAIAATLPESAAAAAAGAGEAGAVGAGAAEAEAAAASAAIIGPVPPGPNPHSPPKSDGSGSGGPDAGASVMDSSGGPAQFHDSSNPTSDDAHDTSPDQPDEASSLDSPTQAGFDVDEASAQSASALFADWHSGDGSTGSDDLQQPGSWDSDQLGDLGEGSSALSASALFSDPAGGGGSQDSNQFGDDHPGQGAHESDDWEA